MRRKWMKLLSLTATAGFLLAACGGKTEQKQSSGDKGPSTAEIEKNLPEGAKLVDDFKATYGTDPLTLDYLQSARASTTDHTVNFIEPLFETDQYGNYIPALAKDYEVSEDGRTYTYHLREGVRWVDVDGNDYAEVKAQDFVTGLKHAVDVESDSLPIVSDSIKNL